MFGFDTSSQSFTRDGSALVLDEEELRDINSVHWVHRLPVAAKYPIPRQIDFIERVPKYLLDTIDFRGKSVLGIGTLEGIPMFYAEARGASRVAVISDDFGRMPSPAPARAIARRILGSNLEVLEVSAEEMSPEAIGMFDIVILFEVLTHTYDPFSLLKRAAALAREELVVATPFVTMTGEFPVVMLFDHHGDPDAPRDVSGINLQWLGVAFDCLGLESTKTIRSDVDYYTFRCARTRPVPRLHSTKIRELPRDDGMEAKTAVLVVSCEKYRQAWRPFFELFARFWPDCPYRVYLGTNRGSYPGVTTFESGLSGEPKTWTTGIHFYLDRIPEDRIILFQEDFLLRSRVDTDLIRRLVRHMEDFNIGCLRLLPEPGPTARWHGCEELGTIGNHDEFRVSCQTAIWNKTVLGCVMLPDEDPWNIEYSASRGSMYLKIPFVSVFKPAIDYFSTAIVRGEWVDGALELLDRESISREGITKKIP